MATSRYHELLPHPALRAHVECFWLMRGASAERRILPDGCVDFLFDRGAGGFGARLVGAMTRAVVVPGAAERDIVAVRFRPGGARALVRAALHEFTDSTVELAAISPALAELARFATGDEHEGTRLRAIEAWLLRHVPTRCDDGDRALAAFVAGGARVDAAAEALGCSRQHFTRLARARTGLSPKRLARIVRLRAALADCGPAAVVAARHGYSDQAHLARDVRDLAGCTWTALRGARVAPGIAAAPRGWKDT